MPFDDYDLIGNIKGPRGIQGENGEQGLPGFEAVPTDAGVAQLVGITSATRAALDLRYAAKTAFEALVSLTTTGRLSKATLDADYFARPKNKHAVFIGSSNSHPQYNWTQMVATALGVGHHNFAQNGGALANPDVIGSFEFSAKQARDDASFPNADVSHVFVTDLSNDIRGNQDITALAKRFFDVVIAAFPNAEIIFTPAIMTFIPVHQNDLPIRSSVGKRYAELVEASVGKPRIRIIPDSWLWFWNGKDSLEAEGSYHLNAAGYSKMAWLILSFLEGRPITNDLPFERAANLVAPTVMGVGIRASRVGNVAFANGDIATFVGSAIDTNIAMLPKGTAPLDTVFATGVADETRGPKYPLIIYPDGTVRSMAAIPGAVRVWYQASYPVM